MTLYHNQETNSPIDALECVATDGKHSREVMTFYYLSDPARLDEAKALLARTLPRQNLAGETNVGGQIVLITRGRETQGDIVRQLHGASQDFVKEVTPKKYNPWKWRGNLSNAGQILQLGSAAFKNPTGFDHSVLGFAVFNLAANMINLIFGAERKPDENRLRHLKTEFNAQIAPYIEQGAPLPDPDHTLTKDRHQKKSEAFGSSIYDFLKRNSVVFGEIGLRYVGAFNLAFPIVPWALKAREAFTLAEGPVGTKLKAGLTAAGSNFRNKESLVFYSGIAYLVGKTIALGSKVPDPYDPKPHTTLDTIRENGLFKLSTAIETGAALFLAGNGLKKGIVTKENPDGARLFTRNRSYWLPEFMKHDKFIQRDWFGATGGALFSAGLAIRFTAPFGSREVNMDELNAHIAAGLAKAPADKLPQLVADSALAIKAQFPDKPLEFGAIYTSLVHELERYHHITLLKPQQSLRLVTTVEPEHKPQAAPSSPEQPSTRIDAASALASDTSIARGAHIG